MNVLKKWKIILDTANAPEGEPLDFISKWLVATRAAVVSMTVFSKDALSIVVFAPISTSSPISTMPVWGILTLTSPSLA